VRVEVQDLETAGSRVAVRAAVVQLPQAWARVLRRVLALAAVRAQAKAKAKVQVQVQVQAQAQAQEQQEQEQEQALVRAQAQGQARVPVWMPSQAAKVLSVR
jgi:hypothetical protein